MLNNNETVAEIKYRIYSHWRGCENCSLEEMDGADLIAIADQFEAAHNREIAAKDGERKGLLKANESLANDNTRLRGELAAKNAEIAELKDCILKEIDWLKRMIKNELEGWATSMWSPSDRFRKHTFSRLIEDNTYHIDRMEKALKGAEDEKDNP